MRIEVNKRLLTLFCAGVFLAGLIGIGIAYFGQVQGQNKLQNELDMVNDQIDIISSANILDQQSAYKDQISQYEQQIADAEGFLSIPMVISNIFEKMIAEAVNNGVSLDNIESTSITGTELKDVPYNAITLNFRITGYEKYICNFINAVSKTFNTGVLYSMNMNMSASVVPGTTQDSTATMRLTIYSYEGKYEG